MSEEIPVARGSNAGEQPTRKVLDQTQLVGNAFDEDILSDIENRLDGNVDEPEDYSPRDKVELDRADLPLEFEQTEPDPEPESDPEEEAEPPEMEVDLAIDAPEEDEEPDAHEPSFLAENLHWVLVSGSLAILLVVLVMWAFIGPKAPGEKKPTPWIAAGAVDNPDKKLRMELEPFLVQLAGSGQGNILKVTVGLEVMQPEDIKAVRSKILLLRDVIYRMLSAVTPPELAGARGKSLAQSRIQAALNEAMGSKKVHKVFFTNFLISG